ncbi:MAG: T9SS type A sorting domain-containing protein [Bacteroidetes bacterium]|nr:T9SS type A sorting domain-containing protein [Bacteroidota bacterium]
MDISKLSSGVYFLQLKTSSGISSGKFVKTIDLQLGNLNSFICTPRIA